MSKKSVVHKRWRGASSSSTFDASQFVSTKVKGRYNESLTKRVRLQERGLQPDSPYIKHFIMVIEQRD